MAACWSDPALDCRMQPVLPPRADGLEGFGHWLSSQAHRQGGHSTLGTAANTASSRRQRGSQSWPAAEQLPPGPAP